MAGRLRRSSAMERIREDLLRRAHMDEADDLEQGRLEQPSGHQGEIQNWFTRLSPPRLSQLFQRRTETGNVSSTDQVGPESPKPSPVSNATFWPTGRGALPIPTRTPYVGNTDMQYEHEHSRQASIREQSTPFANTTQPDIRPIEPARLPLYPPVAQPHISDQGIHTNTYLEHQSAEADDEGRRRQRQRHKKRKHRHHKKSQPMLCCFPLPKSAKIRSCILRCLVSGTFLICLLIIYLALAVSKTINFDQFTVVLILVVVLTTAFFSYNLVRLCVLIIRRDRARSERRQDNQDPTPGCYAVPAKPIRVVLARDEEVVGLSSEASKVTPPAYGIWRESVRVDPNRLFWQRNDTTSSVYDTESSDRPQTSASRRPPSYISDDGVSYVVDAAPRSVVLPSNTYSIPPHPAEMRSVMV